MKTSTEETRITPRDMVAVLQDIIDELFDYDARHEDRMNNILHDIQYSIDDLRALLNNYKK